MYLTRDILNIGLQSSKKAQTRRHSGIDSTVCIARRWCNQPTLGCGIRTVFWRQGHQYLCHDCSCFSTLNCGERLFNAWSRLLDTQCCEHAVWAWSCSNLVSQAVLWYLSTSLPVEQRTSYKLCLLKHYIHTSQALQCLSNCVSSLHDLFIRE